MPRWINGAFCAVWIFTAMASAKLAYDAYQDKSTALTRFSFRIPADLNVQIGAVRFQDVINGLAEAHDQNVAALETSIHQSAASTFILNVFSFVVSIVGLAAQIGTWRHERRGLGQAA